MQMPLNSLKILIMSDLAYCAQLPDGLCVLPCLVNLMVQNAPTIKHVGPEFVQPYSHSHHVSSQMVAAFPKLHILVLSGMVQWEEWEWELFIKGCKLRCIPSGLASHVRALKKLTIYEVQPLQSLENFSPVVELNLYKLPDLTGISNFPKLQKLEINCCRKLESLQEMNALWRLKLTVHYNVKQLPMQTVNPSHLLLDCSPLILISMALVKSSSEWDKFSHIQHVEAYGDDEGIEKRWHLFYTSEPNSIETNIDMQMDRLV